MAAVAVIVKVKGNGVVRVRLVHDLHRSSASARIFAMHRLKEHMGRVPAECTVVETCEEAQELRVGGAPLNVLPATGHEGGPAG